MRKIILIGSVCAVVACGGIVDINSTSQVSPSTVPPSCDIIFKDALDKGHCVNFEEPQDLVCSTSGPAEIYIEPESHGDGEMEETDGGVTEEEVDGGVGETCRTKKWCKKWRKCRKYGHTKICKWFKRCKKYKKCNDDD